MPKMKTKKAAAKRFKLTGTGKLKRPHANTGHKLENRPHKAKKHNAKGGLVHKSDAPRIHMTLPYGTP